VRFVAFHICDAQRSGPAPLRVAVVQLEHRVQTKLIDLRPGTPAAERGPVAQVFFEQSSREPGVEQRTERAINAVL